MGPPTLPVTFTQERQRQASVLGNDLAWGPAWIDLGTVQAVDSEPQWQEPAPVILAYQQPYLLRLLEFQNNLATISYSPTSSESSTYSATLVQSFAAHSNVTNDEIQTTYTWPNFTVTKTLSADARGNIDLDLHMTFVSSIPRSLSFQWTCPARLPTVGGIDNATGPSRATLTQYWYDGYLQVPFGLTLSSSATNLTEGTDYTASNAYGLTAINYVFQPRAASAGTYDVSFRIHVLGLAFSPARVVRETGVLSAAGIGWVIVGTHADVDIRERFLTDSRFNLFRTTPDYYMFQTRW
jgi:hypothetical protein